MILKNQLQSASFIRVQSRYFHEKFQLNNKNVFVPFGYINNKAVKTSKSGTFFDVIDPGSGLKVATLPNFGVFEAKLAIESAAKCFEDFRKTTAKDRAALLHKLNRLILENKHDLAALITAEGGKPIKESIGEIEYGASFIEWFAEEARHINGSIIQSPAASKRFFAQKEPVGVAAIITPWNFPNAMITRKLGAAIAAGCTTVIKPAGETPLSATALAYLAAEAGFPAGAVNVLPCSKQDSPAVGQELCANPLVRKLSFTGSTLVGKILMKQCASTVKRLSLELGGNAPFIVFDDADIDAAVQGCLVSKFRNTGQTCVCVNRIYVQEGVYNKFASSLATALSQLKQGHGFDGENALGPVISESALAKIRAHVSDATKRGAKVLLGQKAMAKSLKDGYFHSPTILVNVPNDALIAHEETFGPVAALFKFKTENEVLKLANDTPFGLAGYVYTSDISRIVRMADNLQVGMVGINEGIISSAEAPFGGVKQSGLGREGSFLGIEEYLTTKYVCLGNLKQ